MGTFSKIAELPLEISSYELEPLEREVSSDFTRLSTVIRLRGGGQEGLGEDVTYDGLDHVALQDAGPVLDLAGSHTIAGFSELIGGLDLFPSPPERDVSRPYRRWAFESAALDLALRQAGTSLAAALGRAPRPVTFVVSLRLGEPASIKPLRKRLDLYPDLRFKLDPTNSWNEELVADLAATGAVESVDFKGFYTGTSVDVETDPELYRMVVEAFPEAWIEDPDLNDETLPLLEPHSDRITWDAPIHSIADIEDRPFKPRMVNLKPSRFGSIEALFAAYDYCHANGIDGYGGGQFELSVGRGQIQYLASLFHPDMPNDTSPTGFHAADVPPGLPTSPLAPQPSGTGFRWSDG